MRLEEVLDRDEDDLPDERPLPEPLRELLDEPCPLREAVLLAPLLLLALRLEVPPLLPFAELPLVLLELDPLLLELDVFFPLELEPLLLLLDLAILCVYWNDEIAEDRKRPGMSGDDLIANALLRTLYRLTPLMTSDRSWGCCPGRPYCCRLVIRRALCPHARCYPDDRLRCHGFP